MSRGLSVFRRSQALTVKEVLLKAIGKDILWIQAADILGVTPRTIRRIRQRYLEYGVDGLQDGRAGRQSPRRASYDEVERILRLYREVYHGFNVKHFHEKLVEQHGVKYSYTWLKKLLQDAGYVKRGKGRGGHRKRRERRPLFGQLVHLDGSEHEWLALRPGERQTLLLVIDDATGRNLAGELVEGETTENCMRVMRWVVEEYGVPAQFYSDRDSVYWLTKKVGGKVDRDHLTQFGRALEQLGVEMIAAYSPQARGRSERWNGTWQGRLINELRVAGIDNLAVANRYIQEVFMPDLNRRFTVEPAEAGSAFISARGADLERIFAFKVERVVAADNTVRINGLKLQIEPSPYRANFVKCVVEIYRHLDGSYSIDWKKRLIGRYDSRGRKWETEARTRPRSDSRRKIGSGSGKTKGGDVGPRSGYALPRPDITIPP